MPDFAPMLAPPLAWIDSQHDNMIQTLIRWANLNTGTYNTAGLHSFSAQLLPLLQQLSPSIQQIPLPSHQIINNQGRPEFRPLGNALSLKSKMGGGENRKYPRVLLNIHYDTVYPPDSPFQSTTRLDANTLRGPGVCDAKGGLLVMLYSLLALEKSPLAENLHWEILLNPDEEIGSPGSSPLFTEAAKRNDLALLFEPALPDGALASARKSSRTFTLIVHGKSAHSGRDHHLGRNAIHALAQLVAQLAQLPSEIPGLIVNTASFQADGPANIVPDFALARINVRLETDDQKKSFEARFRQLSANLPEGITLDLHGSFDFYPKPLTPPIERLLHHFRDCAAQLRLAPLTWRPVGGGSDGNRLSAAGLPNVDSLGPIGDHIHTTDEFIHLDSLPQRTKLTTLFLLRLAAGEIPIESLSNRT